MPTLDQATHEFADLVARESAGEPQVIEGETACVVISKAHCEQLIGRQNASHLGRWLVGNAPRIGCIDLPPRDKDRSPLMMGRKRSQRNDVDRL